MSTGSIAGISIIGERRRVLVIDDDKEVASLFLRTLTPYYDAEAVHTAQEGIDRLMNKSLPSVDCAILDLTLENGDTDGLALIEKFVLAVPLIPLVVVTGYPFSVEQALYSGAQEFLNKPMNSADLIHATIRAMARHLGRPEYCPVEKLRHQLEKAKQELKHEALETDELLANTPLPDASVLSARLRAKA